MRGLTRRMVIASALLALLMGAAFALLLLTIRDQRSSAQLARHSQEVLAAANRVQRLLFDIESSGTAGAAVGPTHAKAAIMAADS